MRDSSSVYCSRCSEMTPVGVGHKIDAELPVGAADLRIVLLRQSFVDQGFPRKAVHDLTSVVGQHVSAEVEEPHILCHVGHARQRPPGGQYHMDAFLHGFPDRLLIPGRYFFSGVGQGAVQIKGDDPVLFIVIGKLHRP